MSKYYPIFIDLENKPVLVIGGGAVACRKVQTLLTYGALVRIISPYIIDELKCLIDGKNCRWISKEYSEGDILDAVLVFSCTDQEEINARVAQDAGKLNRPVNVVDDPDKCSFIVPSILTRGDLSIAVSTGGSSPLAARLIRQELEEIYGDEMKDYLDLLRTWRPKIKKNLSPEKRKAFWEMATSGKILDYIKNGQVNQAKEVMENCFRSLLE